MLSTKKKKIRVDFGGIEGARVEVGYKRWNWQGEDGRSLDIENNFDIKMIRGEIVCLYMKTIEYLKPNLEGTKTSLSFLCSQG